jgi:hypothetical protein
MLQEEIFEFAKLLVQNVRDSAIKSCDNQLRAQNMKAPMAKRWRDAKNKGSMDEFAEMIISDCVDETMFYFFRAIDEGFFNLSLNTPNGKIIDLTTEGLGELSGWYAGEWRHEYSKERSTNDFPDK